MNPPTRLSRSLLPLAATARRRHRDSWYLHPVGSYVGCIAGALSRSEYLDGLTAAGFADASVTFTTEAAPGLHSAIIRAVKPATA